MIISYISTNKCRYKKNIKKIQKSLNYVKCWYSNKAKYNLTWHIKKNFKKSVDFKESIWYIKWATCGNAYMSTKKEI